MFKHEWHRYKHSGIVLPTHLGYTLTFWIGICVDVRFGHVIVMKWRNTRSPRRTEWRRWRHRQVTRRGVGWMSRAITDGTGISKPGNIRPNSQTCIEWLVKSPQMSIKLPKIDYIRKTSDLIVLPKNKSNRKMKDFDTCLRMSKIWAI